MTPNKELDTIEEALNIAARNATTTTNAYLKALKLLPAVREAFKVYESGMEIQNIEICELQAENAKLRARLDRLKEADEEMVESIMVTLSDSMTVCLPLGGLATPTDKTRRSAAKEAIKAISDIIGSE